MNSRPKKLSRSIAAFLFLCTVLVGCGSSVSTSGDESDTGSKAILTMLGDLEVTDANGIVRKISEYGQDANLVVVVSRGYYGAVCPYCSAQVQRLASKHQDIVDAGGKVLVVFPVEKFSDFEQSQKLVNAARSGLEDASEDLPFEIVSDTELNAVDQLDIRDELSKPATYILDSRGKVRYAYIGRDPGDRPKVTTIINQLESLNG